MFPCNLARIIPNVNLTFLFFIALPLGVYLIILVFQTRDFGDGDGLEQTHAPMHAPVSAEPTLSHSHAPEVAEPMYEAVAVVPVSTPALDQETTLVPSDAPTAAQAVSLVRIIPDSSPEIATAAGVVPPQSAPSDHTAPVEELPPTETVSAVEPTAPVAHADLSAVEPEIAAPPRPDLETTQSAPTNVSLPTPVPEPAKAETDDGTSDESDPILPEGPVTLSDKGAPKYAFDYRGRLWVEKKRKGFFRQLRRPNLPPEDPNG